MAMRPSSSSFSYRFTYDMFLSFRGEDTRCGFSGNLYNALQDRGIHTFVDYKELQRGHEITSALEKGIEVSRIFIIVLSQNHASSSFCLNKLAYILNFIKGKEVVFGEALANHEKKFNANKMGFKHNMEKTEAWKMALHQVANLSGYHFNGGGYKYEFIKRIVDLISSKINHAHLHVADYPVRLESQVLNVMSLLDVGSDDVAHMVGIHGLGGVGKTTLALQHLQRNLLSDSAGEKEIMLTSVKQGISIIQYDVNKREQLQAIVGRPDWLGPGSRVTITTQDKQLLACHGVKRTYEVELLNDEDALRLLCWKAFNLEKYKVDSCYEDMSKEFFLDIACCFKEYELGEVEDILHAHHGQCMKHHIGVLVEKSLIKIGLGGKVTLHNLIEDMGKEIVQKESPKEPGKRSRLWFPEDIVQGTRHIEIMFMDFPLCEEVEVEWDGDAFKRMKNLKTLIIRNGLFSEVLEWWRYPSQVLPNDFHPKKLAICKLPNNCFTSLKLATLLLKKASFCSSLESFPEILGKMISITQLDLEGTPIKKFPLSFKNLTRLKQLHLGDTEGWLLPKKGAEKVSSTVSSNIQKLALQYCKLSDEFFWIVLPWFVNVKELDIRGNNFTVIPECIKECFFLTSLYLHHCKLLQEIRGIPPNLKYFSAKNCLSLTSSCRSKLLNLELHEAGNTNFHLPGEKIPEWFEYQAGPGVHQFLSGSITSSQP
uniref:TIR domain-containing protein n=1 Tax=Glycine max TaxID=3847 RepID=A0A0R0G2F8_SOYBN